MLEQDLCWVPEYADGCGEPVGSTMLGDGEKLAADAAPRILQSACQDDRDADSRSRGTCAPLEQTPISAEQ